MSHKRTVAAQILASCGEAGAQMVVFNNRLFCPHQANNKLMILSDDPLVHMQAQWVRHGNERQGTGPEQAGTSTVGHGTERRKDLERTGTGWFAQGQERAPEQEQERTTRGTALVSRPCCQDWESKVQWVQPSEDRLQNTTQTLFSRTITYT